MTRAKDISKVITAPVFSGLTYPTSDGSANQFMKTDGSGTLSFATVDLSSLSPIAGSSSIVTTGALNSGSITSGFGTINNGASAITTTGVVNTGNITATGTLDVTSNTSIGTGAASTYVGLIVNGGSATNYGPTLYFQKGGTSFGLLSNYGRVQGGTSSDFFITSTTTNNLLLGTNNTERMRIDSSGNVAIGQSDVRAKLSIGKAKSGTGVESVNLLSLEPTGTFAIGDTANINFNRGSTTTARISGYYGDDNASYGELVFSTRRYTTDALNEGFRLDNRGRVGIGIASPTADGLHIFHATQPDLFMGTNNDADGFVITHNSTDTMIGNRQASALKFKTDDTERMRISSSGFLGLGTSNPVSITGASGPVFDMAGSNPEIVFHDTNGTANSMSMYYLNDTLVWYGGGSENMRLTNGRNLYVRGALSKGSGSFNIDHPLPSKTETHDLVHSFVEAPQADNIYRGKVVLADGSATINIDTVSGMTEGTYVLLNTNTQCFTSNETGWTAVKGSVSGNTLTITSQVSCTDTISWLVIGERHDQHMIDTEWTDENGKVIVEPLKE